MGVLLKSLFAAALLSAFGAIENRVKAIDDEPPLPIPVRYITEKHITGEGGGERHFHVSLCGGCLYDKQEAIVSLNLQKEPWDESLGDCLIAKVYNSDGLLVGDNTVDGSDKYLQTFNFTYYASHGDLTIKVENGRGSGVTYTLAMRFTIKANFADCQRRSVKSQIESLNYCMQRIATTTGREGWDELVPIFLRSDPLSVKSGQLKKLELPYCFPIKQANYTFILSIQASDETSSFATYVCTHSIQDCTVAKAQFFDVSGSAANYVTVTTSGGKDAGSVTVLVRGDGRIGEENKFLLGTSMYTIA